ncbi:MAG: class I SAM-dependent methyltransferase [Holophaga sp.]|nr:class I SAM-dependent methyltransferase [Holophaga sp.]
MPQGEQVQAMFSGIAGKYDRLNHLLSLGIDFYWWRRMARRSGAGPGRRYLDVAAGTGDSSLALARRGAEVVSTDFTLEMLKLGPGKFRALGQERLVWASVGADAQRLPFRAASFDGITICYGIRNVEDRPLAYREFLRVLKPQGRLTILEFSRPRYRWLRFLYDTYSLRILPRIGGWISGSPEAYRYLPASIRSFPDQPALAAELAEAGFQDIQWTNLTGGIVALHSGRKPDAGAGV